MKKLNGKSIWTIIIGIPTIVAVFTAVWGLDKHWVTHEKLEATEVQFAGALQQQQMQMQMQFDIYSLEDVNRNIEECKRKLRENPDDEQIREDLHWWQEQKRIIQDRINERLRNQPTG